MEANNEEAREKFIKAMKHCKAYRLIHMQIAQAQGQHTNRDLTKYEVPVEHEGQIVGWRTISNPTKLQERVVERNQIHLTQVHPTTFGSGPIFRLLHGGKDGNTWRRCCMEKVFSNKACQRYKLVKKLQRFYDTKTFQIEVETINKPITTQEFCKLFRKKRESTKLLPSHCHVGHYKPHKWSIIIPMEDIC